MGSRMFDVGKAMVLASSRRDSSKSRSKRVYARGSMAMRLTSVPLFGT